MDNLSICIQNFLKYRNLLRELVIRDIKKKYRRSFLGILWSLLNPLLMMVVITIVFSSVFRFDIENFPIYLLTGQIMFSFFSEATSMAMTSIIANASLIKKVYIPKYIFPLSRVLSSFVNLLFSLIAIVIVMMVTKVKITWSMLLFPLPLLYILIFSIGVGMILSAMSVFFRDMVHIYGVILAAWNYLTPIFYPVKIIPNKYRIFIEYNPLYYMVECFRSIILYGNLPDLKFNLICIMSCVFSLIIGIYVFYKNQDKYILYI